MTRKETIRTTWEPRTYDVWGGPDRWEVNDTFPGAEIELDIPVEHRNVGTAQAFNWELLI